MIFPNPRHLRAFVMLAETRSFSTTAATLHVGQPALSQALSRLEEIVGVRLVERTTRSVRLTQAGEEFLMDARRVLHENGRLLSHGSEWAQANRGRLAVLTVPSVAHRLLAPILGEFGRRHPQVQVSLHDFPDPVLRQHMQQGEGDLAIATESGTLESERFLPLLVDELRVALPVRHPLSSCESIGARQIAAERLVLLRRGALLRTYADLVLGRVRCRHEPIEVNQIGTLLGMVEAGLGISVLPGLVCPSPALTAVTSRPLARPGASRRLGFVRSSERTALPSVKAFVEITVEMLEAGGERLPPGVQAVRHSAAKMAEFFL